MAKTEEKGGEGRNYRIPIQKQKGHTGGMLLTPKNTKTPPETAMDISSSHKTNRRECRLLGGPKKKSLGKPDGKS